MESGLVYHVGNGVEKTGRGTETLPPIPCHRNLSTEEESGKNNTMVTYSFSFMNKRTLPRKSSKKGKKKEKEYGTNGTQFTEVNGEESSRYTMATGPPNYKIILCGEYGVGKSSIFRRFMNDTFTTETGKKSTMGLDQSSRTVDIGDLEVKLTLWDTGGMERMSFIGSSYYRGAHAALLCYSIQNKETFNVLSQYILDIVMNAEGAKIFLCGNMADCEDQENKVTEADMENFERECGDVLSGMYSISCKDNSGVNEMFKDMARVLHQHAIGRMTLRRELNVIKPGETPEQDAEQKKKCCG
ncbi:hypothetical protein FSP39_019690 [Pinctada imbricata]|uniref:Uncharacterized protein n=1 Tax=Pinctada imbricata TaxID=66713 RepID=A0AA88XJH9_PINIB|nr:hypothetical protein FSP39_019690 [Pinctada imbricata]